MTAIAEYMSKIGAVISTRLVAEAHVEVVALVDVEECTTFAPPRPVLPVAMATDGLGNSGLHAGPRPKRGPAVRRTSGCTSLYRDRGTSRATFSGC